MAHTLLLALISRRRINKPWLVMMAGFMSLFVLSFYILSTLPLKSDSAGRRGILYPIESESREVKSLDGIWNFRLAPRLNPNLGFDELWYKHGLEQVTW